MSVDRDEAAVRQAAEVGERAVAELVWTHPNVNWRESLARLAEQARAAERERDQTYENGESSGYADWTGALGDFCEDLTPPDGWTPTSTVQVIQSLREARDG